MVAELWRGMTGHGRYRAWGILRQNAAMFARFGVPDIKTPATVRRSTGRRQFQKLPPIGDTATTSGAVTKL
ncbi:protein of unknown function (plasmid) [Methylocella tundrae]|uniref:Uncharacterized protein n=1 Tax=Methylocella tundrae TaxID=227605 RepID=A0A4U8Z7S4_METTU|nr:protein of unknown function [Methylocella tundrae]